MLKLATKYIDKDKSKATRTIQSCVFLSRIEDSSYCTQTSWEQRSDTGEKITSVSIGVLSEALIDDYDKGRAKNITFERVHKDTKWLFYIEIKDMKYKISYDKKFDRVILKLGDGKRTATTYIYHKKNEVVSEKGQIQR